MSSYNESVKQRVGTHSSRYVEQRAAQSASFKLLYVVNKFTEDRDYGNISSFYGRRNSSCRCRRRKKALEMLLSKIASDNAQDNTRASWVVFYRYIACICIAYRQIGCAKTLEGRLFRIHFIQEIYFCDLRRGRESEREFEPFDMNCEIKRKTDAKIPNIYI